MNATLSLYGFPKAWRAELLKIKGSRIILLTILMSMLQPILLLIIKSLFEGFPTINGQKERLTFNLFQAITEMSLEEFGIFLFPLLLVVITARLAAIEHKTDTWKFIETQPVSRLSIWLAKWCMAVLLAALAILLFYFANIIVGYILFFSIPLHKAAEVSIPFSFILSTGGRLWISGLGIITIQLAISMHIRSTIWPILLGLVLITISNILVSMSDSPIPIWPYAIPRITVVSHKGNRMDGWLLPAEWQSLVWLLWAPLAYLIYLYRSSFRLSFSNKRLWTVSIVGILVFSLCSWWIQQPIQSTSLPGKFILAGKIHKNTLPDSILVYREPLILGSNKIPVLKDGSFYCQLPSSGNGQVLGLALSKLSTPETFFIGEGDSAFVDWSIADNERVTKYEISGTVLASNEFFWKNKEKTTLTAYSLEQPEKLPGPTAFYKQLFIEWKNRKDKPREFRTQEGLGLSERQIEYYEKLLAARYITYALYDYPKLKMIQLSDKKYDSIRTMLQPILTKIQPLEDILLGATDYTTYLRKKVKSTLRKGENEDSVYQALLLQHAPCEGRNLLLFDLVDEKIKFETDSFQRGKIIQGIDFYKNPRYKEFLLNKADLLNKLRSGKPAPGIEAFTISHEKTNLSSLLGKYVLIDIWATWCLPCRKEAPYFERLSEKYKDQPIQFLAISVDANSILWEQEVKLQQNRILHWRIENIDKFSKQYGINEIPHYLLIDPDGKIVNTNFPRPSEENFEFILRQVLKLK